MDFIYQKKTKKDMDGFLSSLTLLCISRDENLSRTYHSFKSNLDNKSNYIQ